MKEAPQPPLTTTTSLWPATAVLGAAVTMLAIFLIINLVGSPAVTSPKTPSTTPVVVGGLRPAGSLGAALTYCLQGQEVPSNIADAFVMPRGTSALPGAKTPNLGAGDFDCFEPLSTRGASASAIIDFYSAHLEARGWSLFSTSPSSNGQAQALFQKAGNDGFYWIVGVTITHPGPRASRWLFTIYQNSQTI